jgi:hypothetical protein
MLVARAVILDPNGTLAGDEAVLIGIYEELLRERGIAFGAEDYPPLCRFARPPDLW